MRNNVLTKKKKKPSSVLAIEETRVLHGNVKSPSTFTSNNLRAMKDTKRMPVIIF